MEDFNPIIGWRSWDIDGIFLKSPCHEWFPEQTVINALSYKTIRDVPLLSRVVGTISNWGLVDEHEKGYISEFAYPRTLYALSLTDRVLVKQIADFYEIEYGGIISKPGDIFTNWELV